MKKTILASAILMSLTSCGGYESLSTPFAHRGSGVNLTGAEAAPANEQSNTYEVVVNAPAETSQAVAVGLFENEARKVCKGRDYDKVITASGTTTVRDFGMKGVNTTQSMSDVAPALRGYVTCK